MRAEIGQFINRRVKQIAHLTLQYRQDYPLHKVGARVLNMLPGLSICLYLTLRYPLARITQAALFLYSVIGGSYMVRAIVRSV